MPPGAYEYCLGRGLESTADMPDPLARETVPERMTVHHLTAMPRRRPALAEIWTCPEAELAEGIPACW